MDVEVPPRVRERDTLRLTSAPRSSRPQRFHRAVVAREKALPLMVWADILGYATEHEHMRIYALLCVDFAPLVNVLRRSVRFRRSRFIGDDGSIAPLAVDTFNHVFARFPTIKEVSVNLTAALAGAWANGSRVAFVTQICTLSRITSLRLGGNRLVGIPDAIGLLTGLRTLVLKNNNIMDIPRSIGCLTALQTLDLGNTNLFELPNEIGHLMQLTSLYLHCNRIRVLPEVLGNLTALTRLELISNPIPALPQSIGRLTELRYLSIASAHLNTLPESIIQLTKIETLTIRRHRYGCIGRSQTLAVQTWLRGLLGSPLERAAWRLAPVEVPRAVAPRAAANASALDSSEEDGDGHRELNHARWAEAAAADDVAPLNHPGHLLRRAEFHRRMRCLHRFRNEEDAARFAFADDPLHAPPRYHDDIAEEFHHRRRHASGGARASGGSAAAFEFEFNDPFDARRRFYAHLPEKLREKYEKLNGRGPRQQVAASDAGEFSYRSILCESC